MTTNQQPRAAYLAPVDDVETTTGTVFHFGAALALVARMVRDFEELPLVHLSMAPNQYEGGALEVHGLVETAADVQAWSIAFGEPVESRRVDDAVHTRVVTEVTGLRFEVVAIEHDGQAQP